MDKKRLTPQPSLKWEKDAEQDKGSDYVSSIEFSEESEVDKKHLEWIKKTSLRSKMNMTVTKNQKMQDKYQSKRDVGKTLRRMMTLDLNQIDS